MKVDIDEFRRKLEEYIDPYEIPGAMQAFVEASEDTESFDIWKEKKYKMDPMDQMQVDKEGEITR